MKKKFNILAIIFFILNYFIGNVFAGSKCQNFYKAINDNPEEFKAYLLPSAKYTYTDPGFDFEVFWDTSDQENPRWVFKYTDEGNLIVNKYLHSERNKKIKKGFELISIDSIPVKSKKLFRGNLYRYFDEAEEQDKEIQFKFKDQTYFKKRFIL